MSPARGVPPGYVALSEGGTRGALLATLEQPLRAALAGGSFYGYAEHQPGARPLAGRGVAYAVPLPDEAARVVVRRSRHGGLLAPVTGDHFLWGIRAPHELEVSLSLARRGVPTPEVVAYASYPAPPFGRRVDVVTREVERARDLAAALADPDDGARNAALLAAGRLLRLLTEAGARHPDLNLKNILIAPDANDAPEGWVLDVDRVWFDDPGSPRVTEANARRLARSADRWRQRHGLRIDAARIHALVSASPPKA